MRRILDRISYARIALIQGLYFFVSGVWPVVDIQSFMKITGPKTDVWLVHTVGLLIAVTGAVLIVGAIRWKISPELFILAVGSAAALALIEIVYVFKRVISPIYLADAFIEMVLIAVWFSIRVRGGGGSECGMLHDPTLERPDQNAPR